MQALPDARQDDRVAHGYHLQPKPLKHKLRSECTVQDAVIDATVLGQRDQTHEQATTAVADRGLR